jgi:hypothetical protein
MYSVSFELAVVVMWDKHLVIPAQAGIHYQHNAENGFLPSQE